MCFKYLKKDLENEGCEHFVGCTTWCSSFEEKIGNIHQNKKMNYWA